MPPAPTRRGAVGATHFRTMRTPLKSHANAAPETGELAADQGFTSSDAAVLSRQESNGFCLAAHHP